MATILLLAKTASCYVIGERITVYADILAPKRNTVPSYWITRLPFCMRNVDERQSMYQEFTGHKLTDIGIHILFRSDHDNISLCRGMLDESSYSKFRKALDEDLWAQFWIGNKCAWTPLGKISNGIHMLYTKWNIEVEYSGSEIVNWTIIGTNPVVLATSAIEFSYGIKWKLPNLLPENDDESAAVHRVGMSIFLSVFLILGVALFWNKFIRPDIDNPENFTDFVFDTKRNGGWTSLRGDVFRMPQRVNMLSVFTGTGIQITVVSLVFSVFVLTVEFNNTTDAIVRYCVTGFVVTAPIAGFSSVLLGRLYGHPSWLSLASTSVTIIPFFLEIVYIVTSFFGWFDGVSKSFAVLPLATLTVAQMFLVLPLSIAGGFFAANSNLGKGQRNRVAPVVWQLFRGTWYLYRPVLYLVAGFVCWLPISVELEQVLMSMWTATFVYDYRFLCFVLVAFAIVSACTSVLVTFLLLCHDVHRWHWTSFVAPFTVSVFAFVQVLHFLVFEVELSGFYAHVFYLLYMGVACLCIGFAAGGVGTCASTFCVHLAYENLRSQ